MKEVVYMEKKECFNRLPDQKFDEIPFKWKGPISWPKKRERVPDLNIEGVYLITFECKNKDGYLLYWAGHGKDVRGRFSDHTKKFEEGEYTILDVDCASRGIRKEIWPWKHAESHKNELNSESRLKDLKKH